MASGPWAVGQVMDTHLLDGGGVGRGFNVENRHQAPLLHLQFETDEEAQAARAAMELLMRHVVGARGYDRV